VEVVQQVADVPLPAAKVMALALLTDAAN